MMTKLRVLGLLLAMTLPAVLFASEVVVDDGVLSDEERAELVELLESSRSQLEQLAATGLCQWSIKPDEETWSVGEVVEHIVMAEEGIFGMAMGALEGEEESAWQDIAATEVGDLVSRFQDRSQKFPAPPQFVPTGELERTEVLSRFAKVRIKTLDFVRTTDKPLKRFLAEGPAGRMNVQQWIALIAGHNLRHNEQIEEVIAAVDC